jgi:ubiquinone/menaquinone biosynthesis C-methylase UbiE
MIHSDGWLKYSIWEHSTTVHNLYTERCQLRSPEMDCHAQAADLMIPLIRSRDSILDVGCGSGYFYHSLKKREFPTNYYGIDASPTLIEIGRRYLASFGLPPQNLQAMRIEDMSGEIDHIVCMNVLSNIDNYHRPLERMLLTAKKTVILRESINDIGSYSYVVDKYLDGGIPLKVYVNTYPEGEVVKFMESYGYKVTSHVDQHTGGLPEMVIDHPHHWKFLVARKKEN